MGNLKYFNILSFIIITLIISSFSLVSARTLYVPDEEFPTIQSAINEAEDRDVILVSDGIYYESINFLGKRITVASHFWLDGEREHITGTIISGENSDKPEYSSLVSFVSGEDKESILMGFTLTHGWGTVIEELDARVGGAILCLESTPQILHNIIELNNVRHTGAGMGGGIFIRNTREITAGNTLLIQNNQFCINWTSGEAGSLGGAVCILGDGLIRIENNCFRSNYSSVGGALFILNGMPVLANNVFHGNNADMGGAIFTKKTIQTWYNNTADKPVSGPKSSEDFIEQLEKNAFQNHSIVSALPPRIVNCTFVYNSANNTGSALFSHKARANMLNCIFWDNFSIKIEKPIVHYGPVSVNYCDVQGGWGLDTPNNTNINLNPEFADASSCCLSKDSPCIDKGHPSRTHSDPEDPENPGYALSPAWGTIRNDMGAYGGPCACRWNDYRPVEEKVLNQGSNELEIPRSLTLFQNYPNPFNPSTTISFSIDQSEFVTLRIYNMLGEEVETILSRQMAAGFHQIQWNAENLAGGMYLIRLETPHDLKIKKMVLLK